MSRTKEEIDAYVEATYQKFLEIKARFEDDVLVPTGSAAYSAAKAKEYMEKAKEYAERSN